jgi:surface polysaccharide O-acyltransferase-like enzyme
MRALERRYDIDWLRVLAVLMLIPFHTARIFDIWEPFYAKSDQVSAALTYIFVGGVNAWHMPLFFLLAGASTWFALKFRSGGQYVKERFKRLIVPLLFGTLVIVSPQTYVGALTYGEFEGSFFQYYPRFFQIGAIGGLSGYMGGFTPGHLWFILFLFLISLMVLLLLLYFIRESGQRLLGRLATFSSRPGLIFLWAIPLILTLPLPEIGGKNFCYYLVLFFYGYVLMADARFGEAQSACAGVWPGIFGGRRRNYGLRCGNRRRDRDAPSPLLQRNHNLAPANRLSGLWPQVSQLFQPNAQICQRDGLSVLHPSPDGGRDRRHLCGAVEYRFMAEILDHQSCLGAGDSARVRGFGQADDRDALSVWDEAQVAEEKAWPAARGATRDVNECFLVVGEISRELLKWSSLMFWKRDLRQRQKPSEVSTLTCGWLLAVR